MKDIRVEKAISSHSSGVGDFEKAVRAPENNYSSAMANKILLLCDHVISAARFGYRLQKMDSFRRNFPACGCRYLRNAIYPVKSTTHDMPSTRRLIESSSCWSRPVHAFTVGATIHSIRAFCACS